MLEIVGDRIKNLNCGNAKKFCIFTTSLFRETITANSIQG